MNISDVTSDIQRSGLHFLPKVRMQGLYVKKTFLSSLTAISSIEFCSIEEKDGLDHNIPLRVERKEQTLLFGSFC